MIKKLITNVEFLTPGIFFAEEYTKSVKDRIPANVIKLLPQNTYALHYYDMEIITDKGKTYSTGKGINKSVRVVFGQKIHYTNIDATPDNRILRSNLEGNGYQGYGIHCITGNWQPFLKGDIVLGCYDKLNELTEPIKNINDSVDENR